MIRIRGVHKSFGELRVLQGVDMDVADAEVVCLIGPSGAGKSTLLRCVNLLVRPDRGDVYLGEVRITDPGIRPEWVRQQIGMVFQQFNLLTHLTALKNVMIGLRRVKKMDAASAQSRAIRELERVGLGDKLHAYPAQLSGGQQQRVAIARALAMDPKAMLFDEPTSALDPEYIHEVLDAMSKLAEEGMTMIVVTHEMGFARNVADSVAFMAEGRILEKDTPAEVFERPQHERVRTFVDKILE